jgi:L-ascorbate metabolism protein UlaG (beta-lactamase superfamily)
LENTNFVKKIRAQMKKIPFFTLIRLFLCLLLTVQLSAQERLHYWGDSENFLQDQATLTFENAYQILTAHPPGTKPSNERKLALLSLDILLHDTRLDNGVAFTSYMNTIISNLSVELQNAKPSGKEIHIFRFYNHGFIIKTPTVTVGIDLVRGARADNPTINETLMRSIVEQCDILFITHAHRDHADNSVVKMFCDQGKNVIVPEEIWKDMPSPFRVLRGNDLIRETIRIPSKNTSLTVQVYPGSQGNILNNVYIITLPEGQTIVHTGDQDYTDDLVDKISNNANVDILLVQCWMIPMDKFVSGVKPALVISGHENEVGHTIDHREAYWLTFNRMSKINVPYIIMAWGESYIVTK